MSSAAAHLNSLPLLRRVFKGNPLPLSTLNGELVQGAKKKVHLKSLRGAPRQKMDVGDLGLEMSAICLRSKDAVLPPTPHPPHIPTHPASRDFEKWPAKTCKIQNARWIV